MRPKADKAESQQVPENSVLELQADQTEYVKKLRRRIEDRLRKDREALLVVARLLNIQ
jgi:hypothetical protein